MEALYWAVEFARVAFAYVFILFVWPSVVFRKHLKPRSRTYRFAFCATVMVVLINTGVIGLGLLHLLNNSVTRLVFWGVFGVSLIRDLKISVRTRKRFKNLFSGTYGYKSMLTDVRNFICRVVNQCWNKFKGFMKGHWFEYLLLAAIVLFGVMYFSNAVFHDQSYGFGDMYPHHSWTYNLTLGTIFSGGVYPEGMHCFLYCENVLFGIEIYNTLLFTAGIHSAIILISMFIFFRELFTWKYTPYILLTLYLTVDLKNAYAVTCQSRWQWTMPQEFGFPALFLCAAYLIRYLREKSVDSILMLGKVKKAEEIAADGVIPSETDKPETVEQSQKEDNSDTEDDSLPGTVKPGKIRSFFNSIRDKLKLIYGKTLGRIKRPLFLKEENLFIFTMSLAVTIISHFYTTILAFVTCVCIVIFLLKKVFSKRFVPLCVAAFCGVLIAFAPMLAAFAEGIPPQGSLRWATEIMGIKIWDDPEDKEKTDDSTKSAELVSDGDALSDENQEYPLKVVLASAGSINDISGTPDGYSVTAVGAGSFIGKIQNLIVGVITKLVDKSRIAYDKGFVALNGESRANLFLVSAAVAMVLWMLMGIVNFIRFRIVKKEKNPVKYRYLGYAALTVMSIVFPVMFAAQALGLPYIIEWYRVCVFAQMAALGTLLVPVDLVAGLICRNKDNPFIRVLVVSSVLASYVVVRILGIFHGYLMFELTRFNGAVNVTRSIMQDMRGNDNFTIISSTDEYYQQIEHGFHEEIINFVNESQEEGYTLPTQYLFIYVEKNTIARAQYHVFTGPTWLADEKYRGFYGKDATQCPNIRRETIREDLSQVYFGKFPLSSTVYNTHWQRTILMSKLYVWCQKFNAMYPNELRTYYEDDNFVCYYLVQNPRNLYDLSVFDKKVMIPPQDYADPIWPEHFYDASDTEEEE